MIPKTKTSGIEAFKRLRVYIGVPEELRNNKAEFIQDAKITRAPSKYISVGDVAREIGWHGVLRGNQTTTKTRSKSANQKTAKTTK